MKGRKPTRREMKEDAFVTFVFRASDFIKENRTKVIAGAALAVIVGVASTYIVTSRRAAEEEAGRQLLAGILQQRMENYEGAAAAYQDVLSRFSGTESGKLALLYLGHARYGMMEYGSSVEAYERYLKREKKDTLTRAHAKRGIAACMENMGRYEEAAVAYEETARTLDGDSAVPEDLMAAARCRRLAGNPEEAMSLLQEIVDFHSDFRDIDKAKVLLAELEYGTSK